ncbi:MAG: PAS domain-containing protein [Verrucomicrobiota bacterium]
MPIESSAKEPGAANDDGAEHAVWRTLPDWFFELDRTGRIRHCHIPHPESLQLSPLAFQGKLWTEILPEEEARRVTATLEEAAEKGRHSGCTYSLQLPSGRQWYELAIAIKGDLRASEGGFIMLARNITHHQRAERGNRQMLTQIQEERDRLLCLISSISDEVWFADLNKKFTLANPAAAREFAFKPVNGVAVEELAASVEVYRSDGSIRPVEEAPPLRALLGEVIRNQEEIMRIPPHRDLRYRQVSSTPVCDAAGRIVGSVSVVRDITERKQAEAALRKSEAQLKLVASHAPVLIAHCDRQLRYKFVNQSYADHFGVQPEDVVGRHARDMLGRAGYAKARPFLQRVLAGEKAGYDLILAGKDGVPKTFSVAYAPEIDPAGKVVGLIAAITDITWRKQVETDLAQARTELLQANRQLKLTNDEEKRLNRKLVRLTKRLKSGNNNLQQRIREHTQHLRQLAMELTRSEERERLRIAGILHDHLQQDLVGAKLHLESITERKDCGFIKPALRKIQQIIARSTRVARDLSHELNPIILRERGLSAAIVWLAGWMKIHQGLTVEVENTAGDAETGDDVKLLLFQAVRELLFNVVKHAQTREARVQIVRRGTRQLEIVVRDQGVGFNPVPGAPDKDSRTGFGLFVIRERIELIGGRMEMRSAPGQGSVFRLLAPLVAKVKSPATPGQGTRAKKATRPGRTPRRGQRRN